MPIKIPVFKGSHCVSIVACGDVHDVDKPLLKWMEEEKRTAASFGTGAEKCFLKASFGGKRGAHLHLEVSADDFFPPDAKPNKLIEIDKLNDKLTPFIGKKVTVDLRGMFHVDFSELPDGGIIRALFFKTQKGNVSIKVNGSKFEISGAPVNSIIWQEIAADKVAVMIESENFETTISEDYLTDTFDKLDAALNVFVLGKVPNEQK